ncbi:restriction endonuclease subunit S [Aerococcus viridans]|uniref:restriction endonuclease subunit S n=1 Tax=Aerococcus viridans TaxID=1377 RepID=UPI0028FDC0B1|nr:restriction endonuclease subunit S [Aerococcus viridans]
MSINKDSQKAPNIRFKGFTDDWEQRELENLVTRVKSYSLSRSVETNSDTNTKYIHYGDIHTHVADKIEKGTKLPNIIPGDYETLNKGDLVLADASEDYQGIATPAIVMTQTDYSLVAGLHTIALRPIKIDSLYLYYLIKSSTFRKYGYKVGTGMKVFGISVNRLLEFKAFMPITEEQSKIAELLLLMDKSITLHQRKLDQLNQLKEALLHQMFPGKGETVPKLRFAGFEGDWEERKLGNLLHERNQKSVQTEEYPLVSFTVENGVTEKTERYNRNQLVSGDSDAKVYKVTKLNDIVYNPANLKFGAIDRNKYGKAVFSPIYVTFEVIEDYIFAEFIEFIVTSQTFIGRALKYQQGTVYERQSVGVDDFLNLTIRIPNLDEQKLIGLFLNDLNKELLLQKDKLDQLKNMKQVLLQNMFI